jgi:hypothetical protein
MKKLLDASSHSPAFLKSSCVSVPIEGGGGRGERGGEREREREREREGERERESA